MMTFVATGAITVMFVSAQQPSNATGTAEHMEGEASGITIRDSTAMLLAGETIPSGSFIHLYDSTPDAIATGHVAAKIPVMKIPMRHYRYLLALHLIYNLLN